MGGNIPVIGPLAGLEQTNMRDVARLALGKAAVIRGITGVSTQLLQEVIRFAAHKGLRLPVESGFKFTQEEVVKAYEHVQPGTHIGKACIRVAE